MNISWESLKEKGNDEFRKKNYNSAINIYTQAIGNKSMHLDMNLEISINKLNNMKSLMKFDKLNKYIIHILPYINL